MTKIKNVPMVKNSNQVHTTEDYFMFKPIDGNRNKNLLHINRLKKSMQEHYLFTVIIVNDNYEIIDGQHRFDVISSLNLPLNYIVCEGYGLKEVHILNQISKTWNADDYLTGYCNLGYKDYLLYREFKDQYGLGHNECMTILSGRMMKTGIDEFYRGDFKVKDYDDSCRIVDKIFLIAPYYEGFKRRSFIYAMLMLFKNQNFEFTEFLQKIKLQPSAMVDCTNQSQYVSLIEEIYNYRRREKVNLRY
ncbi:MAG TPA: hypothetical protein VIJ95_07070 [Hanamia sp.]